MVDMADVLCISTNDPHPSTTEEKRISEGASVGGGFSVGEGKKGGEAGGVQDDALTVTMMSSVGSLTGSIGSIGGVAVVPLPLTPLAPRPPSPLSAAEAAADAAADAAAEWDAEEAAEEAVEGAAGGGVGGVAGEGGRAKGAKATGQTNKHPSEFTTFMNGSGANGTNGTNGTIEMSVGRRRGEPLPTERQLMAHIQNVAKEIFGVDKVTYFSLSIVYSFNCVLFQLRVVRVWNSTRVLYLVLYSQYNIQNILFPSENVEAVYRILT